MRHVALAVVVALTIVRILAAAYLVPDVVADAQGYQASARRYEQTGTFAYPLYSSGAWERVSDDLIVSDAGQVAFLDAPRNAYTMPGYPVFLATIWRFVGPASWQLLAARILQALLSVATAWIVYLLGRRFGERTGLIALLFAAIYPPLTLANSYLLTEVLYTLLVTVFVWSLVNWVARPTWWGAAAAGATFSLGLWVRPTLSLWIVFACVLVLVVRRRRFRALLGQMMLMALVAIAVIAPWWIRNYELYGRVVPFTTSANVNGPESIRRDVAEQSPFPWERAQPVYSVQQKRIKALAVGVANGAPGDTSEDAALMDYYGTASRELTRQVWSDYPATMIVLRARSIANAIVTPPAVSRDILQGVPFLVSSLIQAALLVLFVVGVASSPRRLDAALLISIPAYFLGLHAILIPINRYLLPAAPVAMVVAALGAAWLLGRMHLSTPV